MKFSFNIKLRIRNLILDKNSYLTHALSIPFSRLSTMPSLNSTHWTRTHTKIRHSSCSCWETTSRYGRQTHRVMATSHQPATRTNQTKLSFQKKFEMKKSTNKQQLSTKTRKKLKFGAEKWERNKKSKLIADKTRERKQKTSDFSSSNTFDYATVRSFLHTKNRSCWFSSPLFMT